MSEEKLRDYIRRSKDRATGLPFVLVYGPPMSGKTALLSHVPNLAKQCFPSARLACAAVDLRSGVTWKNPSEPLPQLAEMVVKAAWECAELRVESAVHDLVSAFNAVRQEALRKGFWGILITMDHVDFLPNEGIRAICRTIKKMKDEDQKSARRIGVIASSARNLAWLRDQEASPFLAFDCIVLPSAGSGAAHDPLIRTALESSRLPLRDQLTQDQLSALRQWAVHEKHSQRTLRQTLLAAVSDPDLREVIQGLNSKQAAPQLRATTSAFDRYEETGIVIAGDNGHHLARHGALTFLYDAVFKLWEARESHPDEIDGSLAATVRSISAYRSRIHASKNLDVVFQHLRKIWVLLNEVRDIPDLYLHLENAHPNDPCWISFTGERGDIRLSKMSDVSDVILAALKLSGIHRFASVLTDESDVVAWSMFSAEGGTMRLFVRAPRKNYSFNETSLRNWNGLVADIRPALTFLAVHELGLHQLRESGDLDIDRRSVFVVYGHNKKAFEAIHKQLRFHRLNAISWEHAKRFVQKGTPTNLETVQAGLEHAFAVVVLMTGDDIGKLKAARASEDYSPQPRQNVLIEAGMSMAMNPNRTILVHFGDIREASDLAGLNAVEYDYSVASQEKLAEALLRAGCIVEDHARPKHAKLARGK
jgi:Predicted nucleotide-binding protein containing TIR-like domain